MNIWRGKGWTSRSRVPRLPFGGNMDRLTVLLFQTFADGMLKKSTSQTVDKHL